jgi:pullulanase-type alpha-1,6-glucosidase
LLVALLLSAFPALSPQPLYADHTANPTGVALAGDLQSELGCADDWQPDCAVSELVYDAADDLWQANFNLPGGLWAYKVALNDSWDENYGAGGVAGGDNIALSTAAVGEVKFYYDHRSHWITDNINDKIVTAAGSFQGALGCPGDWQPDCLRSWLQDIDDDGIYHFETTAIPTGAYEGKITIGESWDENYGAGGIPGGDNIPFTVTTAGDKVTFTYDSSDNGVTITVTPADDGEVPPEIAALVTAPARDPIQDDVFYFVMPDRFANGDPANDRGGIPGDRLDHGFDPTNNGFFHGGDLAGLTSKLDYLADLGITSIWMTPVFKNNPVQGSGADVSAGYHGYWYTDMSQFDPHFGTNAELETLIAEAHSRDIKIFFDIITNHTADILTYEEGTFSYRNKADFPYQDASSNVFDDRDYAGTGDFPTLDAETSFPYTPALNDPADATLKVPAWLNNPIYYHNRGNSSFTGENSLYGDFFGLDDLFTEHPDVVNGMIQIYKDWITNYDIDGFRVDTVKHVNLEFWQQFVPAILDHAKAEGKPDFFIFGEVFSGNNALLSHYTTRAEFPAVLDFKFQEQVRSYVSQRGASNLLRDLFRDDDYFTDADSNVYSLPTFLGNHDRGRFGWFLDVDTGVQPDAQKLARTQLAHALMYFARGVPVVYYGDEQGFVGDGDDKNARQDMFPSQVATYNDDDLIGTDATTADDNFDPTHPLYQSFGEYGAIRSAHQALRTGAQIHRYSSDQAGIYAFSRIDRDEQVEYLVAVNNSSSEQTAAFATWTLTATFDAVYPETAAALTSDGDGNVSLTLPPLSFAIYAADAPLGASAAAPGITFNTLRNDQEVVLQIAVLDGNDVQDRIEVGVDLAADQFAEVTFAVRKTGTVSYTVIGVDDNAPHRVFFALEDLPGGLTEGDTLDFVAVVNDLNGHLNYAQVTGIKPVTDQGGGGGSDYPYAVIHYARSDGDYGDHTTGDFNNFWGLHLWGEAIDAGEATDWPAPKPFLGEDDYGRFAWIKLADSSQDVNFIVHRGDTKDGTDADRKFNPATDGPEIWLKQDDGESYTSQAAAQGFVTIHYQRPDGQYDGRGLHLWGEAIDPSAATEWTAPKPADGIDDFGAYWTVDIVDAGLPVNFIIHKGDEKDPGPDQSFIPADQAHAYVVSGNETIYGSLGAATNTAIIHYHRADGDYGDPTSNDYNNFWGLHVWDGALTPNPSWQEPVKPAGRNQFGPYFVVPLQPGATELAYILHRGETKDPGPEQFLQVDKSGYEVWQLENADLENPYILPVPAGGGSVGGGDLTKQQAHWLTADTLTWDVEHKTGNSYALYYAADGGLTLDNGTISGGQALALTYEPAGLSDELKAKFPHLANFAAFKIGATDLDQVGEILKGQIAVTAINDNIVVNATGVQIPGVLDDLYTYDGPLGLEFMQQDPNLPYAYGPIDVRLWAPTAKSVKLHLFLSADAPAAQQIVEMTPDAQGIWTATIEEIWYGKYYLYELAVYVPSTGQVETNMVTDPYSLALAMNSTHSLIVDLNDPALKPENWDSLTLPPLAAPEDSALYELHLRDFSANDPTVPEELRGKYGAFTVADSDGMQHLKALAAAGLTHLHLLPVFDIATINEDPTQRQEPTIPPNAAPDSEEQAAVVQAVRDQDAFNWGYDPYHYTVPEGSYASNADGVARIIEFRQMVQALNATGLRVVMDVVYNHTTASGQAEKSVLDKIVPGYYHRLNLDGAVETSTCCANTATEHAMMEKLMLDSLQVWAAQYRVSGFRFDLMGHHMKENMRKVRAMLDALDPSIYVYGEGWNFGEVANNARGVNATQFNMAGTGIGTFNDRLRDGVRGGGPFDGGQDLITNQGFINGLWYEPNGNNDGSDGEKAKLLLYADQIRIGLAGNLADYEFVAADGTLKTGAQIDYNGSPAGYNQDPQEHIIYVEAHDNQTLYDNNVYKLPVDTPMSERVAAQNLGIDLTVLAQGVPFFHAGIDLLRSKSLERNSYNSGDWFNRLFFDRTFNNFGVGVPVEAEGDAELMKPFLANPALQADEAAITQSAEHLRTMLAIRQSSPLFRLPTAADVQQRLAFHNTGPDQIPGVIVMSLSDAVEPDLDAARELIVVVFNANDEAQAITVGATAGRGLGLHPLQSGLPAAFDNGTGTFTVPARTTAVFVDGAPAAATSITIALDAIPHSNRNFRFAGDLGSFRLDDPQAGDRDPFSDHLVQPVEPGTYVVREQVPASWRVTEIRCAGGRTVADAGEGTVSITVAAGEAAECIFVNQERSTVRVRVYHDRNGNGTREDEPTLAAWSAVLYDGQGSALATGETTGHSRILWVAPRFLYGLRGAPGRLVQSPTRSARSGLWQSALLSDDDQAGTALGSLVWSGG